MKKNLYTIDFFFSTQAYERRASLATAAILYPRNSTKAQSFSGRDRLLAYPLLDQGYCNLLSTLFIWKGWSWGWPLPPLLSSWESKWQRTEILCSSGLLFEHLKQQYTAMASGPAVRTTAAVQHHTAHCWPGSCQGIKWETGKLFGVGWVQLVWPFFLKGR